MIVFNHRLCQCLIGFVLTTLLFSMPYQARAGETAGKERNTLSTLLNLVNIRDNTEKDIAELGKSIATAESETQKASLKQRLLKLDVS